MRVRPRRRMRHSREQEGPLPERKRTPRGRWRHSFARGELWRGGLISWRTLAGQLGRMTCVHSKIARPIANVKFAAAGRRHFYLNFSEGSVSARFFRREDESVLIAEVAGNECGDTRDALRGAWEVGDASGALTKVAKGTGVFFLAIALQDDRIDQDLRTLGEIEDLRKLLTAGVIAAVAHNDQGFFLTVAETQVVETFGNRVVEGGSSASGNGIDFFLEVVRAVGERLSSEDLEPDIIVEIDDEHFVLRIAGMSEGGDGSDDSGELGTHAAAVVDDQANSDGSVFLLEECDFLRAAFLEDTEILLSQPRDDISI